MNHFRSVTAALLGAAALVLAAGVLPANAAEPHTYSVSPDGSDANPGTAAAPFQHIEQCSAVMVAGDTCEIASGIYRETIVPGADGVEGAPISYRAAPGATVVVSGADTVDDWAAVDSGALDDLVAADPWLADSEFATAVGDGHIYAAPVAIDPSLPGNQVFVDDAMSIEAQWPYPGTDLVHPVAASAQSGTATSLSDSALTKPAGYWDGARLSARNWFVNATEPVTSSTVGSVTAASWPACVGLSPNQQTLYNLSGTLKAMTHPGEWFYDEAGQTLYLWTADGSDPSGSVVEAKQRGFAVDLSDRSWVTVSGLGITAATVQTSENSHDDVLEGLDARYVSAYSDLAPDPDMVSVPDSCAVLTAGETTSGIQLRGTGNTLRDSTIRWSAGNGVLVAGTGNTVTNNDIRGVDYMASYAAGINVLGADHVITHNTVAATGRSPINIDDKVAGKVASGHTIAYNDLSDYGNQVVDVGGVYVCCDVDLAGTSIDHNWFHDPAPFASSAPAPGVYLDLGTFNATVSDNVAWGKTSYGVLLINPNGASSSGNKVYNNTTGGDRKAVSLFGGTYSDSEIANNIGDVDTAAGVTVTNNLPSTDATDPQFTDRVGLDFTLLPSSPARSAAVVRPPASDGSTDAVPSIGAYQYGAPRWTAGAALSRPVIQAEDYTGSSGVSTHAAGSGIVLGGFDGGDWAKYSAVDFGSGRDRYTASLGSDPAYAGHQFDIRIDGLNGPSIGTVTVQSTGGFDTFASQSTAITPTSGSHDVFLVALGGGPGVANIDSFAFTVKPQISGLTPSHGSADGGTSVVVAGSGFTASASVSIIGGDTLTPASVAPDGTSLTIVTPAHAQGAVQLVVVTDGGESNAVTFTFDAAEVPPTAPPTTPPTSPGAPGSPGEGGAAGPGTGTSTGSGAASPATGALASTGFGVAGVLLATVLALAAGLTLLAVRRTRRRDS